MAVNFRPLPALTFGIALALNDAFGCTPSAAATSAQVVQGSEGAIGVNNASPTGGALEGTVSASGDASQTMPFGVLGEYSISKTTFGIGIGGISTTGYAVGSEVFGTGYALDVLSTGTGDGLQAVTTQASTNAALAVNSASSAITILVATNNYGLEISAAAGTALQASGGGESAFSTAPNGSSYGGSQAGVALANGTGLDAVGGDGNPATKYPALYAKSNTASSNVLDAYNSTGTQVFSIQSTTANASGIAPGTGSDVKMQGDLYVTGGLYECLPADGGCSAIGAAAPATTDVRTRDGRPVTTYAMQTTGSTVEDFGEGRLSAGSAVVRLDPTFSALAKNGSAYAVFLTPGGDTRGLYFTQRTPGSFVVRETGGGRSNLAFSYRIVARRSPGAESIRNLSLRPERAAKSTVPRRFDVPKPHVSREIVARDSLSAATHRTSVPARRRDATPAAGTVAGSEGALAYNNQSAAGSAIEGTVSPSGNTSLKIPFGVLGEWNAESSSTQNPGYGTGAIGTSTSGYGVGGEAFGSNVAILGLNEGTDGLGMRISATGSGTGFEIESAGPGIVASATGTAGGGIFVAGNEQNAVFASSGSGTAADFMSSNTSYQGGGGRLVAGGSSGIGLSVMGYNQSSSFLPALVAQNFEQSDIFDGYNKASTSAVFDVSGTTANASGLSPANGADVSTYGDFIVHGGIFQCTTATPSTCTPVFPSQTSLQSEPTLEASGEARLVNGRARIALDDTFATSISATSAYLVFLTPNGDTADLYYSDRSPGGFTVHESRGGRSNATFSYRVVAKPFGAAIPNAAGLAPLLGPSPKPAVPGMDGAYRKVDFHQSRVRHFGKGR